jgi:Na+-driven multidrug efflux pump
VSTRELKLTDYQVSSSPTPCRFYACSARVSNELGAGRPEAARLATRVAVALAVLVGLSEGLAIFLARNVLGYAYSNDKEVALYTARMMPILAVSALFDSIQGALSGTVHFYDLTMDGAHRLLTLSSDDDAD